MSKKLQLDDIRAAAERKFGSVVVELSDGSVVELKNMLRLSREKRDKFAELVEANKSEEGIAEDPAEFFLSVFEVIGGDGTADKLRREFGGDAALFATLFEMYSEGSEVGEA